MAFVVGDVPCIIFASKRGWKLLRDPLILLMLTSVNEFTVVIPTLELRYQRIGYYASVQ